MSKRVRTLLLSGVAVAVLAVLLVVLMLIPAPDTGDASQTTTTANPKVTVWDKSTGDKDGNSISVTAVTVKNGDAGFTLNADQDGQLLLTDYPTLPHDNGTIVTLTNQLRVIEAIRLIDKAPTEPQKYGFDKEEPALSVSATYSDGSTFAFEIGDENPDKSGRYLRVIETGAIYLYAAKSAETFYTEGINYLSKSPVASPSLKEEEDAAEDTVVVREAELSGSLRPVPIYYEVSSEAIVEGGVEASSTGYFIKKPYFRGMKMDSPLIDSSAYTSLFATSVAAVYPTSAQLAEWGLDNPYSQCAFTLAARHANVTKNENDKNVTTYSYYNAVEYTIRLGNVTEDGLRYAAVYEEGKLFPIVYRVQADKIAWASVQYDEVADSLLFYTYIRNVKTVSTTAEGVTTTFSLTHTDDEDNNLIVKKGADTVAAEGFRELYQSMMALQRSSATTDKPSGEAVFALKITTNTAAVPNTDVKLYPYSGSKYLAAHASGETYLIDAKAVEPFLKQYKEYVKQ